MMQKENKSIDKDILEEIEENFKEAIADRSPREKKWREAEDYYRGKHWKISVNRPYKNKIFELIEGEVPIIIDGSPASDVVAKKEENQDKVKILSDALKFVYAKNNLQLKNSEIARALLKTGTAFLYVDYDPELENGEGSITYKLLPWRYCYPDPGATEIDDCRYFYIRIPMDESEARRKYRIPDEVELDDVTVEMDLYGNYSMIGTDGLKSYFPNHDAISQDSDSRLVDKVIVDECWAKDYSMEDIPDEETTNQIAREMESFLKFEFPDIGEHMNHDEHIAAHLDAEKILIAQALQIDIDQLTEDDIANMAQDQQLGVILKIIQDHRNAHEEYKKINPEGKRPVYPGNLRLTVRISDHIIYDGPSPVNDGYYPVVPFYCYKDENGFWGIGEADNLLPMQKTINELEWAELKGLKLNSNSGWIVDEESGVKDDTLTDEPGLVIVKKQGTEVSRMQPGVISPQLGNRVMLDKNDMGQMAGVNQSSQGGTPVGVTAAAAIEAIYAQSLTRMRLKKKYFWEYSEPKLARLTMSRIITYWTASKQLRLYDNEGKLKYIRFNPDDINEIDYDVVVVPMALENSDKESIEKKSDKLLQLGVIDGKTYVQLNDFPKKAMILRSIEEKDQMVATLQQLTAENEQLKIAMGVTSTNPEKQG